MTIHLASSFVGRIAQIICLITVSALSGTQAQVYEKVFSFTLNNDGLFPQANLIQASDGDFYSTTQGDGIISYGTIFRITQAGVLTTLVQFTGATGNKGQQSARCADTI